MAKTKIVRVTRKIRPHHHQILILILGLTAIALGVFLIALSLPFFGEVFGFLPLITILLGLGLVVWGVLFVEFAPYETPKVKCPNCRRKILVWRKFSGRDICYRCFKLIRFEYKKL